MYGLDRFLVRTLLRLQVEGLENLPDGSFVLTPNHVSYLDPPVVAAALDYDRHLRDLYWAGARDVVFHDPLLKLVSWLSHTVPIESGGAASSSLALGASILKEGKKLVWFPEGQRSMSGELLPFRPGVGILLEHFKTPVIPAFIDGTYAVMPPGQMLPRSRPVKIIFGEPLDPEQLASEGDADQAYDRIVQALHDRVAELRDQTR
jgi:long-chain acyl-CoA synthetase